MSGDDIPWLELARQQSDRFWSKVDRSGDCWLWQKGKCKDGYGKFAITAPPGVTPKQRHVRAHRLAWELTHGPTPEGLLLLHECDTPACVNPAHLSPGTQAKNRADCRDRGRTAKGEGSGKAVMTEAMVCEIRRQQEAGVALVDVARALSVKPGTVYAAASGRTWKHIA